MNVSMVTTGFYRGSRPEGDTDLFTIKSQGVVTDLSLETGFGAWWDRVCGRGFDEKSAWGQYWKGVFISRPCSNISPPTPAETNDILAIIERSIPGGVFLHCYSGVDRTGWIVAAWRVTREGVAPEAAWQEAVTMGMHWRFFWWKSAFLEYCKNA